MNWLNFYKIFSIAKEPEETEQPEKTVVAESEKTECENCGPDPAVIGEHNEQYVNEHIAEDPDSTIPEETAMLANAITDEDFESVPGELPNCEPCVQPEPDAELTKQESDVLEVKVKVKRTPAKTTKKTTKTANTNTTKIKRGRPKKA